MCMFSSPIKEVGKTKIGAFPLKGLKEQLTIYQNTVISDEKNAIAMILPFPNPGSKKKQLKTQVKFIDMTLGASSSSSSPFSPSQKNEDKFFNALDNRFETFGDVMALSKSVALFGTGKNVSKLEIVKVGTYNVSVAHNLEELKKLDIQFFKLSGDFNEVLSTHYANDFGFIVCISNAREIHAEPIAYVHPMAGASVFMPTRHFHVSLDGKTGLSKSESTGKEVADDWDHSVYVTCAKLAGRYRGVPNNILCLSLKEDLEKNDFGTVANLFDAEYLTKFQSHSLKFEDCEKRNIWKLSLQGSYDNIDLVFPVCSNSTASQSSEDSIETGARKTLVAPSFFSSEPVKGKKTPDLVSPISNDSSKQIEEEEEEEEKEEELPVKRKRGRPSGTGKKHVHQKKQKVSFDSNETVVPTTKSESETPTPAPYVVVDLSDTKKSEDLAIPEKRKRGRPSGGKSAKKQQQQPASSESDGNPVVTIYPGGNNTYYYTTTEKKPRKGSEIPMNARRRSEREKTWKTGSLF